jgi:hypothetical protein
MGSTMMSNLVADWKNERLQYDSGSKGFLLSVVCYFPRSFLG